MKVTNIVNIDLSIRQNIPFVDAVQGDSARAIEFRLFDKGQPFNVPDGSAVLIRYKRPDGFGGVYDTLPNGETAYSISSNKVTAVLSPTALGAAGEVDFQISIMNGNDLISIFSLQIRVDKDPYIDSSEAEDYVNITGVSSNEIAISSTAPTDDKVKLWINPDEVEEDEGGDSTLLVVTFTTDESGKHTPSHTYDQIKEWLDNGGSAVLTNGNQWYNLAFMNASTVWFERTVAMSTGTMYVRYVITAMGQMTKTEDTHKLVNVTAEVGQTIIVKEVDEKGKPTKWESAEYQPRTHWSEYNETVLADNQTCSGDGSTLFDFLLVEGQSYHVVFNGVGYDCVARTIDMSGMTMVIIGNEALTGVGSDTGEPFLMQYLAGFGTSPVSADGSNFTLTLSTAQETVHQIPAKYLPDEVANYAPYYVTCIRQPSDNTYFLVESVALLESLIDAKRQIVLQLIMNDNDSTMAFLPLAFHKTANDNEYGKIVGFAAFLGFGTITLKCVPQEDGTYAVTGATTG